MKREIMTTGDGSKTIYMPDLDEQYHSKHGALQEALHVFIKTGLEYYLEVAHLGVVHNLLNGERDDRQEPLQILEYGFGTGLNAMLTAQHDAKIPIQYTAVEAFPILQEEVLAMDYGQLLKNQELYELLHQSSWEENHEIHPNFMLRKKQITFELLKDQNQFDLIYFDAFGPRTQPELWTIEIFAAAYASLKTGGILTTYCAAGQVRRNMQTVGFRVERLPGPPGKREMLRASKK
ncbi:MAG: tRNA U34 5-methylaminomethyl-2-thiouridine-forming methyltransferase MnmC [Nonlabens sp.]|jgi:tRNA U34 5-methylaminomethyl-2-thiouridine-forming methyltransferase MnmC|uniref:tRNA (5-methylaminomethyl-2-thiouridine)(34)-methyltransferase MnmD n=1 Tax=Nonlabens sp. TaxID=1888209 RepID=UPI0039E47B21